MKSLAGLLLIAPLLALALRSAPAVRIEGDGIANITLDGDIQSRGLAVMSAPLCEPGALARFFHVEVHSESSS